MSDSETKQVTGVCTEIAQKPGSEWVEFHIDAGGKYPVRLSTKLQPLIELGRAAGQQLATWTYNETESDKINEKSGKPYVNRYLERVEVGGGTVVVETATADGIETSFPGPAHKPLIAGDKDRAITRMACLKAACELHQGLGAERVISVLEIAARFETWVYRDIDEVPFE